MEDRHTIIANYQPATTGGSAVADAGVLRSFAAVYDGHNGSQTAEEACSRCCSTSATVLKPISKRKLPSQDFVLLSNFQGTRGLGALPLEKPPLLCRAAALQAFKYAWVQYVAFRQPCMAQRPRILLEGSH